MAGLTIKNLKKSFGTNTVIQDISFDVSDGAFCILLGPSGCGKTTILRIIAGLEEHDEGEIFMGNKEVGNLSPKERDVAMVFQSYALYPHMNVYENMAFSLKVRNLSKDEIDSKVREAARLLDIEDFLDRKPKKLSGGQRQRVAIGRAIVRSPQLFLFDEPLSNLDARLRSTMRVELAKLHQQLGTTIVYVTHDQIEAMTLGDKIILLDKGIIQQVGTPQELYERPSNLFVATFIGSPQINLIEGSLLSNEGRMFFKSGGLTIDLGPRTVLEKYSGNTVILGIRPESLTPGNGPIVGSLEIIEHIGSENILYVATDIGRIIAKAPPDFQGRAGEGISLALRTTDIHLFYKGIRIAVGVLS
ncbi:MAG: sn-glycerol-3-phosphate ABC transporter ATP-binding protein UgpC [Desulfobacterales bacterium]|nr:sn-glycerol-3-phosphate ABC transporter ATP-binding protein UgpC [Desulfobacterales bacterium]